MNDEGIFLTSGDVLQVLVQQPYASEQVLQRALADHPEVIAGPTTAGEEAGRLILVRREMGVPGVAGGPAVWSLDHLFLDAEGVPVVVEVKRSTDTRIRREVVGQMLDYAANGVKYWPVATLRTSVEERAAAKGLTGEELVASLRTDIDADEYWQTVEANLAAGRIRMLFVADSLPPELVRIIEFLNEQMSPAEVLGVELRQYVGDGHTVYVPRVVGRTSAAVAAKVSSTGQLWTEDLLLEAARSRTTPSEFSLIGRLFEDVHRRGVKFGWGKGVTPGASGWYSAAGVTSPVWNLNVGADNPTARAYLYFYLGELANRIPVGLVERMAEVLKRIPSMSAKIDEARTSGWKKYPSVYLDEIARAPTEVEAIFQAIDVLLEPPDARPTIGTGDREPHMPTPQ